MLLDKASGHSGSSQVSEAMLVHGYLLKRDVRQSAAPFAGVTLSTLIFYLNAGSEI